MPQSVTSQEQLPHFGSEIDGADERLDAARNLSRALTNAGADPAQFCIRFLQVSDLKRGGEAAGECQSKAQTSWRAQDDLRINKPVDQCSFPRVARRPQRAKRAARRKLK